MNKAILVNKSGEIEQIELKNNHCLSKCLKRKGKGKIDNIYKWKYKNLIIHLYGFYDGEAGDENKFELPPPKDSELFFGDMLFISYDKDKIDDLILDDFVDFYNEKMGGFENIESSSEGEDDQSEDSESSSEDEDDQSEDSEWNPGSKEESSSDEDFDEDDEEEEEDEEEDDEEEDEDEDDEEDEEEDDINDKQIKTDQNDDNSEDSISILSCNYDKDNLDELLSSSADSELSEEEIYHDKNH